MLIRFIGDVHGKYEPYKKLIKDVPTSIQVGDMGVGFRRNSNNRLGEEYGNPPHYAMVKGNHRFIRGNHDNPSSCKNHSQYISDGTVEGKIMLVGGALSIDKEWRIKDINWWEDEELSQEELDKLLSVYLKTKPEIMVTHDCPEDVAKMIVGYTTGAWVDKLDFPSRTRVAFQHMISGHSPKYWIFGHWHVPFNIEYNLTNFICLPELGHIDLEV